MLLRPRQIVISSMVVEHAFYPRFCALSIGVSEAQFVADGKTAYRHLGSSVSHPRLQSLHRLHAGKLWSLSAFSKTCQQVQQGVPE